MELLERMQARMPAHSKTLGVRLRSVELDRVTAELVVRDELCNTNGVAHGGVLMSFADVLGATATVVNLPKGANTTTLESKTNFFAPALAGTTVQAETLPLHRGRRTMTWQTRLTNADGRLLAVVTQTQMVLEPRPRPEEHAVQRP